MDSESDDSVEYNIRELIKNEVHSLEQKTSLKFEANAAAILLKAQQELVAKTELGRVIEGLKVKDDSLSERMWILFGALLVGLLSLTVALIVLFMQHMGV